MMRALVFGVLLSAAAVTAQSTAPREGRPMAIVDASACTGACRVLQRRRVGGVRVWVQREGPARRQSYSLVAQARGRRHAHLLGGDGPPGYGGSMPQSYTFDRIERIEIDGERDTPEVAVLGFSNGQPTATVCRLAPTPCCLFDMVAGRRGGRLRAPTFDSSGRLETAAGPVPLHFCP